MFKLKCEEDMQIWYNNFKPFEFFSLDDSTQQQEDE